MSFHERSVDFRAVGVGSVWAPQFRFANGIHQAPGTAIVTCMDRFSGLRWVIVENPPPAPVVGDPRLLSPIAPGAWG